MSDSLSINGFSAYAGFNGSVASVVTKAEIGLTSIARPPQRIAEFLRPDVPNDFPESSRINRNANQLRILNNLEGQFKRIQGDRDVAGQTLGSVRNREGKNDKTLKEINAYRQQLYSENKSLLNQGSAKIQKQKNDKENASIVDQIAKSRGFTPGSANAKSISLKEINDYKLSNNVGSKASSNKKKIKTKPKVKNSKVSKLKKKR